MHVASCSFGKDSMATILLALKHGEPLDEVVYCEVMFDDRTSGEVPEHRAFIYETAIPWFQAQGIPVRILKSRKTYVELFSGRITRGPKKGLRRAFPLCGRCYVQRDCKLKPIHNYQKTLPAGSSSYIGIAMDEHKRLRRLGDREVSLLEKYNYTEENAKQLCQEAGLLSPVYNFAKRGGCWFCPNASDQELRHIYDFHPELWERMLELQRLPDLVSQRFNRKESFANIDKRFRGQDDLHLAAKKGARYEQETENGLHWPGWEYLFHSGPGRQIAPAKRHG